MHAAENTHAELLSISFPADMLPTASCSCCARTPAPCDSFRGPARGPPGRETAVLLTAAGCCGSDAAVEVPTGCAVAARPRHALLAAPAAVLVLGARAVLAGAEAVLPADVAGLDAAAAEPPKKLVMLLWFDGVAGGGFFLGICAYRLASCCHCCCISESAAFLVAPRAGPVQSGALKARINRTP